MEKIDRVDDVVTQLKQSKARGLSFNDARQALLQSGFSNAEIDDASHKFDYLGEDPWASNSPLDDTEKPNAYPLPLGLPGSPATDDPRPAKSGIIDNGFSQLLLCSLSILLVWYTGNRLNSINSDSALAEFYGSVVLSASIILYYGFIVKDVIVGRFYMRKEFFGRSAAWACLVWFAILAAVILKVLR
jgi:hypothetical protein